MTDDIRGHGEDGLREAGWISLRDRMPPDHCGALLVTNNLNARNAFGHMSHIWLVKMVHQNKDGFSAFAQDGFQKVESLTHWRLAVPATPIQPERGMVEALRFNLFRDDGTDASLNLQGALDDLQGRHKLDDGGVIERTLTRVIDQLEVVRAALSSVDSSKGEQQ